MNFFKKFKFDKEEKEQLESIEKGEWIKDDKKAIYAEAAKNTLNNLRKDTTITLRINSEDLKKLKMKAQNEGLPYQTYIGTLIHKNIG